ncbi:sigma-54-dependent transcriptional regulator [Anaeromyxobacter dehalogenans]|uniref:Two component, sigma54 specific, transcriptional regulator, Fis family n=1 Tax=Anaeromyxobacter dehalogenans (strain 2CP-C) TaxID=290397 RepID=Q2IHE3_ANADE|nr:sigma-54 dependent transcriptional regulator [Anaeromyxobacter dehalogenans]ABC84004.1 two component, sigma54 specific, transcriptional regulator, Fis family [Anaeromyxobacter dehalogenans 2CP-C]
MARILVADDHDALREGMVITLARLGHDVLAVRGGAEAIAAYRKRAADVVVTDLRMVPVDGIEVVRRIRAEDPDATVVVISAHGTIATAVDAMREGAIDFLEKPFSTEALRARVEKAVEIARERRGAQTARARAEVLDQDRVREREPHGLVGSSEPMRRVHDQIRKVAPTDATVLVLGESGTGKELVARAIHEASLRREKPFVSISCAAIPEGLLESELFGHERGAFTGAIRRKLGRFELAHEGTLFLDEVGEIPPSVQVKLLRVLQERCFERVGGEETVEVDVRVISATNRDLTRMVAEGRFREDLYYRLNVVPIQLPPLRERPGDVDELARAFLERLAPRIGRPVTSFAPEALELLRRHPWPGNVRELENVVEQALVFADGAAVRPEDLPEGIRHAPAPAGLPVPSGDRSLTDILEDLEQQLILAAYEKAKGVKAETARLLGIKPSALYYKLEKYGIVKQGERGEEGG